MVTGAAGGIGSAISRQLIAQGATVHGLDLDADGLRRLGEDLPKTQFLPYVVDLRDRAALDRNLVELIDKLQRRCDVLVNNAGVARLRSLAQTDDGLLDWLLAVNFVGSSRVDLQACKLEYSIVSPK